MATINTVNFDDLFDFSPEPLELQSSPNPHSAAIPRSVNVLRAISFCTPRSFDVEPEL